jgi:hypothetical protein
LSSFVAGASSTPYFVCETTPNALNSSSTTRIRCVSRCRLRQPPPFRSQDILTRHRHMVLRRHLRRSAAAGQIERGARSPRYAHAYTDASFAFDRLSS